MGVRVIIYSLGAVSEIGPRVMDLISFQFSWRHSGRKMFCTHPPARCYAFSSLNSWACLGWSYMFIVVDPCCIYHVGFRCWFFAPRMVLQAVLSGDLVGSGKGRVRVRFGPNPNPAYSLPRAISRFAQKHVCVDFIYQRIEPRQKPRAYEKKRSQLAPTLRLLST